MASNPASSKLAAQIRTVYRDCLYYARHQKQHSLADVRSQFRAPLLQSQSPESRLKEAQKKLSFFKMTSVRVKPRHGSENPKLYVYKDGTKYTNTNGTFRDDKGRTISNWDGNNLDPEMVKRHHKSLKRMGFANNAHAKSLEIPGLF